MDRSLNIVGLLSHLCLRRSLSPRKWRVAALVVSSVLAAPIAGAIELDFSGGQTPTVNLTPAADQGSSVVVSKRQEPQADAAPSSGALEPISQYSEEEPELADPEPVAPPKVSTNSPAAESAPDQQSATAAPASDTAAAQPAGEAPVKPVANPDQPSSFRGVTPGLTTRAELQAAWGSAQSERTTPSGTVATYGAWNCWSPRISSAW